MAAPKGNQFAIGNSGRDKKWDSVDTLQKDINDYFESCDKNLVFAGHKSDGTEIFKAKPLPYTVEGLCESLECDRDTLLNYQKTEGYEEFFGTIKRAKNKIQRQKVENGLLGDSNATITIFDLKNNHGYKDKTEVETTEIIKPEKIEFEGEN